jgi:hypothetical protein
MTSNPFNSPNLQNFLPNKNFIVKINPENKNSQDKIKINFKKISKEVRGMISSSISEAGRNQIIYEERPIFYDKLYNNIKEKPSTANSNKITGTFAKLNNIKDNFKLRKSLNSNSSKKSFGKKSFISSKEYSENNKSLKRNNDYSDIKKLKNITIGHIKDLLDIRETNEDNYIENKVPDYNENYSNHFKPYNNNFKNRRENSKNNKQQNSKNLSISNINYEMESIISFNDNSNKIIEENIPLKKNEICSSGIQCVRIIETQRKDSQKINTNSNSIFSRKVDDVQMKYDMENNNQNEEQELLFIETNNFLKNEKIKDRLNENNKNKTNNPSNSLNINFVESKFIDTKNQILKLYLQNKKLNQRDNLRTPENLIYNLMDNHMKDILSPKNRNNLKNILINRYTIDEQRKIFNEIDNYVYKSKNIMDLEEQLYFSDRKIHKLKKFNQITPKKRDEIKSANFKIIQKRNCYSSYKIKRMEIDNTLGQNEDSLKVLKKRVQSPDGLNKCVIYQNINNYLLNGDMKNNKNINKRNDIRKKNNNNENYYNSTEDCQYHLNNEELLKDYFEKSNKEVNESFNFKNFINITKKVNNLDEFNSSNGYHFGEYTNFYERVIKSKNNNEFNYNNINEIDESNNNNNCKSLKINWKENNINMIKQRNNFFSPKKINLNEMINFNNKEFKKRTNSDIFVCIEDHPEFEKKDPDDKNKNDISKNQNDDKNNLKFKIIKNKTIDEVKKNYNTLLINDDKRPQTEFINLKKKILIESKENKLRKSLKNE